MSDDYTGDPLNKGAEHLYADRRKKETSRGSLDPIQFDCPDLSRGIGQLGQNYGNAAAGIHGGPLQRVLIAQQGHLEEGVKEIIHEILITPATNDFRRFTVVDGPVVGFTSSRTGLGGLAVMMA